MEKVYVYLMDACGYKNGKKLHKVLKEFKMTLDAAKAFRDNREEIVTEQGRNGIIDSKYIDIYTNDPELKVGRVYTEDELCSGKRVEYFVHD